MPHFPDTGRKYALGTTDITAALVDWDAKAQKTMNGTTGDDGIAAGSAISNPAAPIIITGAGLALQNPAKFSGVQTYQRRITPYKMCFDPSGGLSWALLPGGGGGVQATNAAAYLWLPLAADLIDGSTIIRASVWFIVDAGKPGLPVNYPYMFLERRNEITGVAEAIPFVGSNQFPTPANLAAYKNGAVPNVISAVPSNAGSTAVVDLSKYSYAIGYLDDDAAGAVFNTVTGFELQMNINDQRQP